MKCRCRMINFSAIDFVFISKVISPNVAGNHQPPKVYHVYTTWNCINRPRTGKPCVCVAARGRESRKTFFGFRFALDLHKRRAGSGKMSERERFRSRETKHQRKSSAVSHFGAKQEQTTHNCELCNGSNGILSRKGKRRERKIEAQLGKRTWTAFVKQHQLQWVHCRIPLKAMSMTQTHVYVISCPFTGLAGLCSRSMRIGMELHHRDCWSSFARPVIVSLSRDSMRI